MLVSGLLFVSILAISAGQQSQDEEGFARETAPVVHYDRDLHLAEVSHWFYYLGFEPDDELLDQIVDSSYDMVVMEPIFYDRENTNFPIAEVVARIQYAPHPKLVIAYIDIGQAEDWRTYWQPDWGIGNPDVVIVTESDIESKKFSTEFLKVFDTRFNPFGSILNVFDTFFS